MPETYSEEFKATALELLDSGMTQQQVCADLGSPKSILQLWMKNHRRTQHGFEPSETTQDRAEQTRMIQRICELEQENTILREAAVKRPGFRSESHEGEAEYAQDVQSRGA